MNASRRLLVFVMDSFAALPKEGHKPEAEHVERYHSRGDQSDQPEDPVSVSLVRECLPENLILREKSAKWWKSCDGERSNRHHPECPRNQLSQSSHVAHVLLAAERVNHRSCCEKEQGFEKRMRHKVENARRERGHTAGHKHVAKLRDRGVCEDALNIVLHQADAGGEDSSQRSDNCNHAQRFRRAQK